MPLGKTTSIAKAVRELSPVLVGGRGVGLFLAATGGWLAQNVVEWAAAAVLLVFLHSLGLVGGGALPDWLPRALVDLDVTTVWVLLLAFALIQSAFQIASYGARILLSERVDARLRMLLAHETLLQTGPPPQPSRWNYLAGEIFPRTANFFFEGVQVASFAVQGIALLAAMLYVAPGGALTALGGFAVFGAVVLRFNREGRGASAGVTAAQRDYERSKTRFFRNWLFIRALRLEREEYAAQIEASASRYRHSVVAFLFGHLGSALGPTFGMVLLAVVVLVHSAVLAAPAANLLALLYLLFRFQQLVGTGAHLIGGLSRFESHVLEAARFVATVPPADLEQALAVERDFRVGGPRLRDRIRRLRRGEAGPSSIPASPPAIRIRALTFRWPGGEPVFPPLDVEVGAGQQLAIVGPNGSGKSTLLALLLGPLAPTAGEVLLDGIESARWVSRHRDAVGFVGAEPYLVAGTLRENLTWGLDRPAGDDEILAAADRVGFGSRVRSFADGLGHRIDESATGLSAGEKQKLAIARALLRQPRLLVLDEPTAHVDEGSEQDVVRALEDLRGECTVVIVSHTPAVLRHADVELRLRGPQPGPDVTEVPVLDRGTRP